ncbi:YtxH domain-containing protein [Neobacillus thermocopriae]|uniref:YtxH domain-containing protein n=1 Tax=Neobacillus thermocopriae TaxID=1215031 RepID=UPI0037705492
MSKREIEARETRKEVTSSSFLLGAIIGGVVGAAAALLLAPKSGKEMRKSITGQADTIIEKSAPLRDNVKSKTISLTQGIAQQSTDLFKKVTGKQANEEEILEGSEIPYIPLQHPQERSGKKSKKDKGTIDSEVIRKKLAETQKAFEEEENKVKI